MGKRRRKSIHDGTQTDLFPAPTAEQWEEAIRDVAKKPNDDDDPLPPRCVICGEGNCHIWSMRHDGSVHEKCHDEWLEDNPIEDTETRHGSEDME